MTSQGACQGQRKARQSLRWLSQSERRAIGQLIPGTALFLPEIAALIAALVGNQFG
jgi:hypothetical protein